MLQTTKQLEIIENLQQINERLANALRDIKQENKEGQFDYCTSPLLSDLASAIEQKAAVINSIVYQNN